LVRRRFALETPDFEGWISLDLLGFAWIISSESRLINVLRGFFLKVFFSRFCRRERAVATAPTIWHAKGNEAVHGGQLKSISDFLQEIAGLADPPGRLHPKASRSNGQKHHPSGRCGPGRSHVQRL